MSNQIKIINGHKVNVSSNSDNVQLNLTIKDKGISRDVPFNKSDEFKKIKKDRERKEEEKRNKSKKDKGNIKNIFVGNLKSPLEMASTIHKMSADKKHATSQKTIDFLNQKIKDWSTGFKKMFGFSPTKSNFERMKEDKRGQEIRMNKQFQKEANRKWK